MAGKAFDNWVRKLNNVCIVVTLLAYLSSWISPLYIPFAAFLALGIPLCLIANLLFVLYWAWKRYTYIVLSLLILLIGYPFVLRTFRIGSNQMPKQQGLIKVLSYNTRVFNSYQHLKNEQWQSSKEMISFVKNSKMGIICLQEVYDNDDSEVFDIVNQMLAQGYQYYRTPTSSQYIQQKGGFYGQVIFSRYPIIGQGELKLSQNRGNRGIYVDLIIRKDTIRVYNVHLQSMSIDENALINTDVEEAKSTYLDLYTRLKRGFAKRTKQIQQLQKHIDNCPFPVLVCGDFNEMPYGYTYRYMKRDLDNAFEEAGQGFGFTYNGKLPFLRIDHQFYDPKILKCLYFKTITKQKNSDHFPTLGVYQFKK